MTIEAPYQAHGTHLPVLAAIINVIKQNAYRLSILEIGAGDYSTHILGCATAQDGYLWTVEAKTEWRPQLYHPRHTVSDDSIETDKMFGFSLALIDGDANRRLPWLKGLTSLAAEEEWRAKIVVVHDTEPSADPVYGVCDRIRAMMPRGNVIHVWDPWHDVRTTVLMSPEVLRSSSISFALRNRLSGLMGNRLSCKTEIELFWRNHQGLTQSNSDFDFSEETLP